MIDEIGIPTTEIEADGFITRPEALERASMKRAIPAEKCIYPHCEECGKYSGGYCTVPMVVSKQIWLTTESLITRMEKRLTELENLVTDEILHPALKSFTLYDHNQASNEPKERVKILPADEVNYTWADYFKREDE